ncbi:MAG: DUF4157 domain-containing protein, partial [Aphanizomenon sp.]
EPMETAFDANFSRVKVHTDGESDQLNKSLNSRAFATGQDIFFSQGAYNPGSRDGQELLAHELTHIVQQNGGIQRKIVQHQTTEQKIVQMMPKVKSGNLSVKDAQIALAKANKELAFELAQTAADIAGIVDPTPISDGISAAMSLAKGDYVGAGLSIVSMIPYLGDTIGKPIKAARNGKKILKLRKEIAELIQIIEKIDPQAIKQAKKTKEVVSPQIQKNLSLDKLNTTRKVSKQIKSVKSHLKEANLPIEGKIRYVPPKNWHPSQPLPRGTRGGYKDRFGNEWVSGPSRTKGEPFEWDVQLGAKATPGMRNLSIDGRHVNVSLKGRVTH